MHVDTSRPYDGMSTPQDDRDQDLREAFEAAVDRLADAADGVDSARRALLDDQDRVRALARQGS